MNRIIRLKTVSDYIESSQNCILPVPTKKSLQEKNLVRLHEKTRTQDVGNVVKISLSDCLACSGCVTTTNVELF